jgi:hypothetical protein
LVPCIRVSSELLRSVPWQFLDSCLLKMGPIDCPETSVRNYNYSLSNNPEERSSLLKAVILLYVRNSFKLASH